MAVKQNTRTTNQKKGATTQTPKAYGLQEVADILGVHYRTMQRVVAAGDIKVFYVGKKLKVNHTELMRFMGEA